MPTNILSDVTTVVNIELDNLAAAVPAPADMTEWLAGTGDCDGLKVKRQREHHGYRIAGDGEFTAGRGELQCAARDLAMRRRALLTGVGALALAGATATVQITATAVPSRPGAGMRATVTIPPQPGVRAGNYVFDESAGETLADWVDPRGAFTLALRLVARPELPGFRVIFVRSRDGQWASVEFWLGTSTTAAYNIGNGYSVAISGDFAGSAVAPNHWWGSRWRLSGNPANGLRPGRNHWPYPLTGYAALLSDRLIPSFDPTRLGAYGRVPSAMPYTPMGTSSLSTYMPMTGGRADIGIFTEWDAAYFQAVAPSAPAVLHAQAQTALATLLAINEAGASISWFVYDQAHGRLWEPVTNNVGKTRPAMPHSGSRMPLICTGTVGATITSSVSDSVHHDNWWAPVTTIPASGTITVTADSGGGGALKPTGVPIATGGGGAGVTYAWGDPAQFDAGSVWAIDSAHEPTLGYTAYILLRDPWDLHTIQASAMLSAGPTFWPFQVRQAAWDYTHASLAWVATPADVPAWLVPKSTLKVWKDRICQWVIDNCITGPAKGSGIVPLATVFHSLGAGRPPGVIPDDYWICNNTLHHAGDSILGFWQEAMFAQAASLGAILEPGNAAAKQVAQYSAHSVSDRYDGRTGWPRTVGTPYYSMWRAGSGKPAFASWAEAWALNAPFILNKCPPASMTPPAELVNIGDYGTHDFAALSLAVQAGLDEFRPARDYLAQRCIATGTGVNWNRAFTQV